jgi:hypothetical protein
MVCRSQLVMVLLSLLVFLSLYSLRASFFHSLILLVNLILILSLMSLIPRKTLMALVAQLL